MINLAVYDYHLLADIKDFDVHYICSKHLDYQEDSSHVYHKVFKYNKLGNPAFKAFSYVLTYIRLLSLFFKLKPKLVHVQWFRLQHFDLYYYRLAKKLFGFKLVYTAHNILPLNTGDRYMPVFSKIYTLEHGEARRQAFFNFVDALRAGEEWFDCPDEDTMWWCRGRLGPRRSRL